MNFVFQSVLPVLDNLLSKKVRGLIDNLRAQRSRYMKVTLIWTSHLVRSSPGVEMGNE